MLLPCPAARPCPAPKSNRLLGLGLTWLIPSQLESLPARPVDWGPCWTEHGNRRSWSVDGRPGASGLPTDPAVHRQVPKVPEFAGGFGFSSDPRASSPPERPVPRSEPQEAMTDNPRPDNPPDGKPTEDGNSAANSREIPSSTPGPAALESGGALTVSWSGQPSGSGLLAATDSPAAKLKAEPRIDSEIAHQLPEPSDSGLGRYFLVCAAAVVVIGAGIAAEVALTWKGRWEAASLEGYPPDAASRVLRWVIHSNLAEVGWILWVAAVSATIGSFLNVVVYRMPRGLSLGGSPSACVGCGARIRWYDNVPILGWFFLGGRCRACHVPFSGRYPLVEAISTAVGLVLFLLVVQLPTWAPPHGLDAGRSTTAWHYWLLQPAPAQGIVTFFYWLPVLMATVAMAWSSHDRQSLPARFYFSVLGLVWVGSSLYRGWGGDYLVHAFGGAAWGRVQFVTPSILLPVQWLAEDWPWLNGTRSLWVAGLYELWAGQASGMVVGGAIGYLLSWVSPRRETRSETRLFYGLLGFVGGWYLPLMVGLLSRMEARLRSLLGRHGSPDESRADPVGWWSTLPYQMLVAIALWRWFP